MNKMRILAVDDNAVNLATLEQELKEKYDLVVMNSGSRAVRFLKKEHVDLVLLDVQMAFMDGIETLREIRALDNGDDIPVIFLTSKKDRETVLEGTKLGIMDYVLKPFNTADLTERMDRVLKKVGAIPVTEEELYNSIDEVVDLLEEENIRGALAKLDDLANCQMDKAVLGRIRTADVKLRENDLETANRILLRVRGMLQRDMGGEAAPKLLISLGDMNAALSSILEELGNYSIDGATKKITDLLRFRLPPLVDKACVRALTALKEYDDGEAETLIRDAVAAMKKMTP